MRNTRFLRILVGANLLLVVFIILAVGMLYQLSISLPGNSAGTNQQLGDTPANILGLQTFTAPLYVAQIEDAQINILQGTQTGRLETVFSFDSGQSDIPAAGLAFFSDLNEVIYAQKNLSDYIIYRYASNARKDELFRTDQKLRGIANLGAGRILVLTSTVAESGGFDYKLWQIPAGGLASVGNQFTIAEDLYVWGYTKERVQLRDKSGQNCTDILKINLQPVVTTCSQQFAAGRPADYIAIKQPIIDTSIDPAVTSAPVSNPVADSENREFKYVVYRTQEWATAIDPGQVKPVYESAKQAELELVYQTSGTLYAIEQQPQNKYRKLVQIDLLQADANKEVDLAYTEVYNYLGRSGVAEGLFFSLSEKSANTTLTNLVAFDLITKRFVSYEKPSCSIISFNCNYLLLN